MQAASQEPQQGLQAKQKPFTQLPINREKLAALQQATADQRRRSNSPGNGTSCLPTKHGLLTHVAVTLNS
jgi:hypothetical protein